MANTLKPKRSSVAGNIPTTTNLSSGEMGVNMADQKVWINNGTSVVQIGSGKLSGLADVVLSSLATGQGLSWNGTNWVNSSAGSGTVTSVSGTGTVSGLTLTGSVTGSGSLTLGGTLSLTSGQVTTALGFTPYNATNPSGYITGSGNAATATALQTARTINGVSFNGTANITVADATKLPLSGGTLTGPLIFGNATSPNTQTIQFGDNTGWTLRYMTSVSGTPTERFRFVDTGAFNAVGAITQNGNQVLHAGNFSSYAPSLSSTYADPAWISSLASSKLTGTIDNARLNGGTYTINVTGNAGTATTLQTARTINGVSFNGSANITVADSTKLPLSGGTMSGVITTVSSGTAINFSGQSDSFGYNATAGLGTYIKGTGSTYLYGGGSFFDGSSQRALLHAGNFSSYSPSLTGSGASGTWGINVTGSSASTTGNAATATALQTARTINGVSFNGTANITVADSTKLPLTGGTLTGQLNSSGGDSARLFQSNNTSAGGPAQFFIDHNLGDVNIGNARGRLLFPSNTASTSGMTAWNVTSPGTSVGNYHIGTASGTGSSGGAITFGARDASSGANAQAGIYITSDGSFGTRMYLATTDSYATGARTSVSISEGGNVNIVRGALTQGGNQVLHAGNFTSYSPSLTGAGASGTWNISITGSVGSAGTLSNNASISGLNFGGVFALSGSGASTSNSTGARLSESYGPQWNLTNSATWHYQILNGSLLMGLSANGGNYGGGNIYATGSITAYYSDERLKTSLGRIENALEKVRQLEGFRYINNDLAKSFGFIKDEPQLGLSAQAAQRVAPETVSLAPFDMTSDPESDGRVYSKSGENYLTVQYDRLVPLLVEAIKEQDDEVVKLAKDNVDLRARVAKLEALVSKLVEG